MKERNDAVAAAEKCERKMSLAQRLVGALGSELDRWTQSIIDLGEYLKVIIGDVLLLQLSFLTLDHSTRDSEI
jgi:dynein heavy chain